MWPFQRKTFAATMCGHPTTLKGEVRGTVEGHRFEMFLRMPRNKAGSTDWCLDCCGKMTIRCAWCGEPIMIGDPVTLYSPAKPDFVIPPHAVVYDTGGRVRLVGCGREDCADTGADYAGTWVPGPDGKGMVSYRGTAFEHMLGRDIVSVR